MLLKIAAFGCAVIQYSTSFLHDPSRNVEVIRRADRHPLWQRETVGGPGVVAIRGIRLHFTVTIVTQAS
jgi:hypothetical protein